MHNASSRVEVRLSDCLTATKCASLWGAGAPASSCATYDASSHTVTATATASGRGGRRCLATAAPAGRAATLQGGRYGHRYSQHDGPPSCGWVGGAGGSERGGVRAVGGCTPAEILRHGRPFAHAATTASAAGAGLFLYPYTKVLGHLSSKLKSRDFQRPTRRFVRVV